MIEATRARKFYLNFINEMIESYDMASFLTNRTSSNFREWFDTHEELLEMGGYSVWVSSGMTKAVIGVNVTSITRDTDCESFVVKIPFKNRNNYCQIEAENYVEAKKAGLEELFAWCDLLGTFLICGDTIPVYIMEYAEANEDEFADYVSSVYPNIADEYCCTSEEACVEEVLAEEWGKLFDAFLKFADEMGITDLHGGNIGRINDCYVLIDYSGYFG